MEKTINDVFTFAEGLDHPECIAVHPDGSVWAGGEAGQLYRISADGKEVQEVYNTGGFILGIAFSPDASWLAVCDLKNKCVWKYHLSSTQLTLLSNGTQERRMKIPNYPVFDKEGNLYVSDSGAFRQVNGCIFKINTKNEIVVWHKGPFNFSNGMALSAMQNQLYVVCSWLPGIEVVTINQDGSAGQREVLVRIPQTCPDGIAIDIEGNLYVSCYAPNTIFKIDKEKNILTLIHDWEAHTLSNPTNIAFGGKNHKQLYIANLGRWHIGCMAMDIAGLNLFEVK